MSKGTTEQLKHTREFWCLLCDPKAAGEPMEPRAALAHIREVHKTPTSKGTKQVLSFLDGDTYTNTYEWKFPCEVGEVKLLEVASGPRSETF